MTKTLTKSAPAVEGEYIAAGEDADLPPEGMQPRRCECGNARAEQFVIYANTTGFVSPDNPSMMIQLQCSTCGKKGPKVGATFMPYEGPSMDDRKRACAAWNEQLEELTNEQASLTRMD